ncbi:hypothetical protein CAPTEDRAFT_205120 [Capitella teleta]|uniref:Nose resistant-to-fluoxetine protein N-terminal domain-containing protein n=1 Tax=Capitella teleta TaxID=283909 RepID=R7U0S4_CAPTE|nr:hypothetical protein CAPTEDRAFT_205120 [Capitella teleta]|eukprot:ELT96790.1 hypothetical protein CAPTEDRAFT_205120 [Capitella teleta]
MKVLRLAFLFGFLDAIKSHDLESSLKEFIRIFNNDAEHKTPVEILPHALSDLTKGMHSFYHAIADGVSWNTFGDDRGQSAEEPDQCYSECRADFDAFLAPITNPLYNRLIEECEVQTRNICRNGTLLEPPQQPWAAIMLDAAGKIPHAFLEGKLHWVGAYDQCHDITAKYNVSGEEREFAGQYARLDVTLKQLIEMNITNLHLSYGLCVPNSCTEDAIYQYLMKDNPLLSLIFNDILPIELKSVYTGNKKHLSKDPVAIAAVAALSVLAALVIAATIYEQILSRRSESVALVEYQRRLSAKCEEETSPGFKERWKLAFVNFSIHRTGLAVFSLRGHGNELPVCNLSLGNRRETLLEFAVKPIVDNLVHVIQHWLKIWHFQVILHFYLTSDTLLFISAALQTFCWLQKTNSSFRISKLVKYIGSKLLRAWVPLAFTVFCYVAFMPYLINGPLAPSDVYDVNHCYDTWWSTLLFINNFVHRSKPCLMWSSQISVQMQLHLVSSIVLILLSKFVNNSVVVSITELYLQSVGILAWYYDFMLAPWCRAGPYIIGMTTGILVYHYKDTKIILHPVYVVLGWFIAIFLTAIMFVTTEIFHSGRLWPNEVITVIHVLSHNGWSTALLWITVMVTCSDYTGFVKTVLTHKIWQPLSRLVYQAVLVHSAVILCNVYNKRQLIHFEFSSLQFLLQYLETIGNLWTSLFLATIAVFLWQYPVSEGIYNFLFTENRLKLNATLSHRNMASKDPKEIRINLSTIKNWLPQLKKAVVTKF